MKNHCRLSLKTGGTFVLNCQWKPKELEDKLPKKMLQKIAEEKIDFYCINAIEIAEKIGLGNRINMIMQGAFFKLTGILPEEEANRHLKEAIEKAYEHDNESINKYANVLYTQALLMEGILPSNPKEFADILSELMINSIK